jgi:osmotically-inducible protein OsmY
MIPTMSTRLFTRLPRLARSVLICAAAALAIACGRSDSTLQTDTEARLAADPEIRDLGLSVTVQEGVVHLSGETRLRQQQDRAIEIARSVDGVTDVVNEMKSAGEPLERAVKEALARDPLVGSIPIDVEAQDADILLRSDQTNQEQRTRAVEIARQVEGVEAVEDLMK